MKKDNNIKTDGKSFLEILKKVTPKQWIIGGSVAAVGILTPVITVVAVNANSSSVSFGSGVVVKGDLINLDETLKTTSDYPKVNEDILNGKFSGFIYKGKTYNMVDSDDIYEPLSSFFDEARARYPKTFDENASSFTYELGAWNEIDGVTVMGSALGEKYELPSDFPEAPENTYYEFNVPSVTGEEIWARNLSSFRRYPTPWLNDVNIDDENINLRVRVVPIAPYGYFQDVNMEFNLIIDNSNHPRVAGTDISSEFDWEKHITVNSLSRGEGLNNVEAKFESTDSTDNANSLAFRDKYVQSISVDPSYQVRVGTLVTITILLREGYVIDGSNVLTKTMVISNAGIIDIPKINQDDILGSAGELIKAELKFYDDNTGVGTVRTENNMAAPDLTQFVYAITQDGNPPAVENWKTELPTGIDISSTSIDRIWVKLVPVSEGAIEISNAKQLMFGMQDFDPEIVAVDLESFFGTNGVNYSSKVKFQSADFTDLSAGFEVIGQLELEAHAGSYYEYAMTVNASGGPTIKPDDSQFSVDRPKITGVDGELLWVKLSLTEATKDLYEIANEDAQPISVNTSTLDETKFLFDDSVLRGLNFADYIEFEGEWITANGHQREDDFNLGIADSTVGADVTEAVLMKIPATMPEELQVPVGYELQWRAVWWGGQSSWTNPQSVDVDKRMFATQLAFSYIGGGDYTRYEWQVVSTDSDAVLINGTEGSNRVHPASGSKWDAFVADNKK